jgi:hypothetical protein
VAGEGADMTFCWERATPVAHMHRGNRKEQAPLEWRAPSEETEK